MTWNVIDKYFGHNKGDVLVKHLTDSFNDFVSRKLEDIINGFNPIEIQNGYIQENDSFKNIITIEIKNPTLANPTINEKDGSTKIMTPGDARNRNFTYAAPLTVTINVSIKVYNPETGQYTVETKKINNVSIGKLPIMVRSKYCILHNNPNIPGECKYDYGGYFIVNGNEKVVISQDRIAENKTYVFTNSKLTAYSHVAEIRSVLENRFSVPKTTTLKLSSKANQFGRYIRANIHHIKLDIPLFVLFRALGLETDKEIISYICHDVNDPDNYKIIDNLVGSAEEGNTVQNMREAREYLIRYMNISGYPKEYIFNKTHRLEILNHVLQNEFLPHCGTDFKKKAIYLGYMVMKLLKCYLGLLPFDDRDSYINKRVDTPGVLMANLFRQYYGKVIKDLKNGIQKDMNGGSWKGARQITNIINNVNINKLIKSTTIESGLKYGLATGNWGIKSNKSKQGVAQVLNRMTYNATMSHLRRINTPIEKTGKLVQPRKLHSTQWGIICPAECFDPKTPILMWDGSIKKAQDIVVGDKLIDDNGDCTQVRSTCSGHKTMYEIIQHKNNFMNYTVTDNHILTLKVRNYKTARNHRGKKEFSWFDKKELKFRYKDFENEDELKAFSSSIDDDNVIDITIEKYLSLPVNVQKELYMFKSDGINWERKDVLLDPYILGLWLGDGKSHGYGFVTADKELLDKWIEWGKDNDATIKHQERYYYGISSTINNTQPGIGCNKTEKAPLKKLLSQYNLVNNKHIPMEYLVNDRKTRLALLAGLIDTDGNVRANGHEIRISQGERNYRIIYDAEFLARSLGFSCHVNDGICSYTVNGEKRQKPYKELYITGQYLYEIPTVLPRKQLNEFTNQAYIKRNKSSLQTTFTLVKKDVQPFVGWQVHGSGRFLLGDMSVTHNTPEGVSVGLVKNMSLIANISIASNSVGIRKLLSEYGVVEFNGDPKLFSNNTKIIVNGDIIGVHSDPHTLFHQLKKMKRQGAISIYTGIAWNVYMGELNICTEGGRCLRPMFIVHPGNKVKVLENKYDFKNMEWADIVIHDDQLVEFMDVEECNNAMIAMKANDLVKGMKGNTYPPNYTHMEMDLSLIMGVLAASIPFSDHNQAPRNCYQSAMGKQAIGLYISNFKERFDTLGHVLNYPQLPFVQTKASKIVNNDKLPRGMNAIVAIGTWTGFNQEDSIIMNQSAVDRGMFTSTYYRTYKEQNNKNHSTGEEEYFCKPTIEPKAIGKKPYNYNKLNDEGFVPENTLVEGGDVIVGKCMPQKNGNVITYKDTSVVLKANECGFIDKNCYNDNHFTNINGDGYTFAKVRIRSDRTPQIGDKFCVPGDTEVMTLNSGWKPICEIEKTDLVAQLDPDTHELQFVNPTNKFVFQHNGPMYKVRGEHVDMLTTMDHKMYVKPDGYPSFQLIKASEIVGQKVEYLKTSKFSQYESHITETPIYGFSLSDAAEIYGLYMNCGTFDIYTYSITFNIPSEEVYAILSDYVAKYGWYITIDNGQELKVKNGDLYTYLTTTMNLIAFPHWFYTSSKLAKTFIDAVYIGKDTVEHVTKERGDELNTLAILAGYNADLVHVSKRSYAVKLHRQEKYDFSDIKDEVVDFMGSVYCIEVPSHIFMIRYNNKAVWTGNSSTHGQKGTVGMLYRQADMPFSAEGLVPDIIINPHAIPSRMTIAQLMECIMGKACCSLGTTGDGTPFTELSVEDIAKALETSGLERYGNEILYNSRTGEQMNTNIFIGPTYYQRLKHMVSDKMHSRNNNGPILMLTRQPAEGRARDGGLRLGEMEVECNWAHGTMNFLKERFMECSDNYRVFVCKKCGMIANVNPEKNIHNCKACKNVTDFSQIRIPYSSKLLFQEVQTMGIATKFIT